MASDRDDDDTGLEQDLLWRDDDSLESLRLPHDGRPPGPDAWRYVQDLVHVPAVSPPDAIAEVSDDLRTAGRKKLAAAGLYGDVLAPTAFVPTPDSATDRNEDSRLRSWKLPARMQPGASLYDNLAPSGTSAPQADTGRAEASASAAASPETSTFDNAAAAAARSPTPSPLDHPDARTGLALTAADALLRRGVEALADVAGGNRPLLQQIVATVVAWLGSALPPEYRGSAAKSGEAALADAHRRIDERDRATRTRAAIGMLANRRLEAEHEHVAAVVARDRAKIAEARRELVDAWRAERRARGDGEAEINASARELERAYRETALRNRLAKMDEAGIKRALDEDDDAKADPAAARAVVDDILRIRREDAARAGEASNEREISAKKRDGRIDTPEEETRERYELRLKAQVRRGIPEGERRILTNAERAELALEYHRIESTQGKAAADAWLDGEAQKAGPREEQFKAELATKPRRNFELPSIVEDSSQPPDANEGRVEPAQTSRNDDEPRRASDTVSGNTQVQATDRRQPEPPIASYSVGTELGAEQPTSPLRELRKLIGRLRSVAALKDDGSPVASDSQVAAFLDEARKHIRPEYQDVFEITVLAVRAGMIPWWRAQERLREYYAPESTGEAILDGILDVLPIVSQVKGTVEIGEALDGLRIALDEGDEAGAAKFAAEAGLLIAGLVPFLKAGKFAKHVPGLEKLKDILGEFAGGKLPFQEFLQKWNKNWKLQGHYSFPIFLGGARKEGIAKLRANVHHRLHNELNVFLQGIKGVDGKHMRPVRGNKGELIRERFKLSERVQAMADFYNGPGNKLRYRNARREFFALFPELIR